MPEPDPNRIVAFPTPNDLFRWLETNHTTESELWVKIYKKGSGVSSVTWEEVVIELLCWGWIDGVRKSLDDQAYLQRVTPRKKKSSWSKRNREHVERLITEKRMREPGLLQVQAARADGRWDAAYAPQSEMEIPADFIEALESRPKAKAFFATLNRSNRFPIFLGLTTAKKPETRANRFARFLEKLERGEKFH